MKVSSPRDPRRPLGELQGGARVKETIGFNLNGKAVRLQVDPSRALLWVLRDDLGLTGSKYGCGEGLCGACTVLVGRQAVRSCQLDHDALQCGYCTPGMIMNAYSLLLNTPQPSRRQIIEQMDGNLCRCGAHKRIVQAIQAAAKEGVKNSLL
jgi:aerobic-type carbon monoxide dehydrogenase small subunit (CoxS/CutS family)